MNDLLALSYADRRALVNALAALRKRPWRLLMWAFWIALIGGFGWLRTAGPGPRHAAVPLWQLALQDFWACGFLATASIVLATGGARFTGFFGSRAEALALVRAPLATPLIAAYLQARAIVTTLAQTFARFAYIILIGIPTRTTPLGLVRELALLAAATIALTSVMLPRALARGGWRIACIGAGCALGLAALLPLARDALLVVSTPAALALAHRLPAWHPGLVFDAVARGELAPVGAVLLVALLGGTAFVAAARDAYPELYELSLAHLELRTRSSAARARAADALPAGRRTRTASARAAPRGALAFVWLDGLTWSRRAAPAVSGVIAALALGAGCAAGLLARGTDLDTATITILTLLPNLTLAIASTAGIRLAADLRRPLFWLGEVSLFARLAAWTYASLWRDAAYYALVALGFGSLTRAPALAATLLGVALGLSVLARAVGTAVFALVPNALDQRGPAVLLRLALAYALVLPVAGVAGGVGFLTGSLLAASAVGFVLAAAEAGLLIGFAAWRLAGRVDALATA